MSVQDDGLQELLFKSLDGALSAAEQRRFEEALKMQPGFRKEYAEMVRIREALASWSVPGDAEWSDREVDDLIRRAYKKQDAVMITLGRQWQKIAAACLLVLAISLGSIYLQSGSLNPNTLVGIDQVEAEEAYTYLNMHDAYDE